jgi:hypothetical protein
LTFRLSIRDPRSVSSAAVLRGTTTKGSTEGGRPARRYRSAVALLAIAALALAACAGGGVTASPPPRSPVFPLPSETPSATSDPSGTPVPESPQTPESPTPAPSRSPGTAPVYGAVRVRIVRVRSHADAPAGPAIVTTSWVAAGIPGSEVTQVVQDVVAGDFRVTLTPFDVAVLGDLAVTGGSFGFEDTTLPTNGPDGTDLAVDVPGSGCAYVGRMTFTYLLLPPGDGIEQLNLASDLAAGGSLSILFTSAGTFVYLPDDPSAHRVDVPDPAERPAEARRCPVVRIRYRDLAP